MRSIWIILLTVLTCSKTNAQYKNLVLEGGGVRGIAYVGVVQALEEVNALKEIENISGTSVGAITAAFLCIGYTSSELERELSSLKIQHFNDGKGIFIGGIHRTNKRFGWYRGEKLTAWVNEMIEKKTGVADLTFGELAAMADTNDKFKKLYITATNLTQQCAQTISHINYPDMRIADGIRISASVPLYYAAIFMDKEGNVYQKPPKDKTVDVMVDGGFIANYPIHVFDDRFPLEATLGIRLDESEQIQQDTCGYRTLVPYPIDGFKDYIGAFYNLVIENLNRNELTEDDWKRTISVSTCGIGPKVKKLSNQEVDTLITSGYNSTRKYLQNFESF